MDIASNSERFHGTVKLPNSLTYTQYVAIDEAVKASQPLLKYEEGKKFSMREYADYSAAVLPGVLACVEEWHIDGVPENPTIENFPMTPVPSVFYMLAPIVTSLMGMITEADEIPN